MSHDQCSGCVASARAREAAAEQLETLSAENDALAEQVFSLQRELDQMRKQLDAARGSTKEGGSSLSVSSAPASTKLLVQADTVETEGDGCFPRRLQSELRPHGAVNIIALTAVAVASAHASHGSGGGGSVVFSAGADRKLVASFVGSAAGASEGGTTELASVLLAAPGLCLAVNVSAADTSGIRGGLLAAGLMDGRVALLQWVLANSSSGPSLTFVGSPLYLSLHSKYVIRVAWSPCGRYVATASHDRSLALLEVVMTSSSRTTDDDACCLSVRKVQQCYFKGPVEALVWAWTPRVGSPASLPLSLSSPPVTLVAASRGSSTLHYITVIRHSHSHGQHKSGHTSTPARIDDASLLASSLGLAPGQWLPVLSGSSDVSDDSLIRLLLHRVPLSEDGAAGSMFLASHGGSGGDSTLGQGPLTLAPVTAGGEGKEGVEMTPAAASPSVAAVVSSNGTDADDASSSSSLATQMQRLNPFNSAVEGGPVSDSTLFPGPTQQALTSSDATEGARYIPVGFAIVDLAVPPHLQHQQASAASSEPVLAACADNGVIYLFRFGSNALVRRLVGHVVGSGLGATTRIAWLPQPSQASAASVNAPSCHYLAASSERDFCVVIYSTGSGQPVARLGVGQPLPMTGWISGSSSGDSTDSSAARSSRYGHNVIASRSTAATGSAADVQSQGHTASIKDLAMVMVPKGGEGGAATPALVTCGFDKRLMVWA